MAVEFRIHPAIGVARVGNSPTESFLGPEDEGDPPPPPGGFRDAKGLLKPQAARFSVWASKQGAGTTTWHELTADLATITWHVAVKNDKPAAPGLELSFRNVYLQAVPGGTTKGPAAGASVVGAQATVGLASGAKTANLTGSCTFLAPAEVKEDVMAALMKTYPYQTTEVLYELATFLAAGGTAAATQKLSQTTLELNLGRLEVDAAGHLLVIGGSGGVKHAFQDKAVDPLFLFDNFLLADDVADGSVEATVVLTPQGAATLGVAPGPVPVQPAWVVIGPPNYGRVIPPVTSVLDVLEDRLADTEVLEQEVPNFERDIAPLLRAASDVRWAHSPVRNSVRHDVFSPAIWPTLNYQGPDDALANLAAEARIKILGSLATPADVPASVNQTYASTVAAANPTGSKKMPVSVGATVTRLQYVRMIKWASGNFAVAAPADPPPVVRDRGALRWLTGRALKPGVEVSDKILTVHLLSDTASGMAGWIAGAVMPSHFVFETVRLRGRPG